MEQFIQLWKLFRKLIVLLRMTKGNVNTTSCIARGGDLGGGDGPPTSNLRWGDCPCIGPPIYFPIFWEVVLSDVRESMNRVKYCFFLVRKWSYTTFNIVNIRKIWEKKGKIRRTRSMTKKKGHQKFLPWKWKFFLKLGREKKFLVPPKFGARSPPMCIAWLVASHF